MKNMLMSLWILVTKRIIGFNHIIVFLAIVIALACAGCYYLTGATTKTRAKKTAENLNNLDTAYLHGNIDEARNNLLKGISCIAVGTFVRPDAQAVCYYLGYLRLSALEEYAGNPLLAESYLLKARYWKLMEMELSGMTKENAIKSVMNASDDDLIESVREGDVKRTLGHGPAYLQDKSD